MRPDNGIVITCEHAANRVPGAYAALFTGARTLLDSHRGYDAGAQRLARLLARRLGITAIVYPYTRLLVDPNRSVTHRDLFSSISSALPAAERAQVIDRYYRPHRDRVIAAVDAALRAHARVVHLAVHSFTPVFNGVVRNADIGLLYDPARKPERRWCDGVQRALADCGLRVRRNYPYRGAADGLTTALRRRLSARRYLGIEIELNQALLTEPARHRRVLHQIAEVVARQL